MIEIARQELLIRVTRTLIAALVLVTWAGQSPAGLASSPVVGNSSSKTYHREDCGSVRRMSVRNRVRFASFIQAEAQGFQACRNCRPNEPEPLDHNVEPVQPLTESEPIRFTTAGQGAGPSFSKDIAPVLVANCLGCHNAERKRGGLEMSSFRKLMAGGESGSVIEAMKPETSELILRITGESTPKMPPGNNRNIAESTIEKISQWIKEGALLDAGVDADASLAEIAATPDELRSQALEKMTPEERSQLLEAAAAERWKKVLPDGKPLRIDGEKVAIFGNLPEDRAERLAKALDRASVSLSGLLSRPDKPVLAGPQKLSIYVFNDRPAFTEFVRTVLRQEVDETTAARGDLKADPPFLAVLDPLGGASPAAEPNKKADRRSGNVDVSLEVTAVDRLAAEAALSAGTPPRWLALGLGKYLASQLEPRGQRPLRYRTEVATQFQLGWMTKSQEALGDQGDEATVGSMGFSLIEFLTSGATKAQFPAFTRGLLDGGNKLDEGLVQLFGVNRQDFLANWGQFVAARYGRGRP